MTGEAHHHNQDGRNSRHDQASIYAYLREHSKRAGDAVQQQRASQSTKQIQRHLHGRMPTTGGHGRTSGPR